MVKIMMVFKPWMQKARLDYTIWRETSGSGLVIFTITRIFVTCEAAATEIMDTIYVSGRETALDQIFMGLMLGFAV